MIKDEEILLDINLITSSDYENFTSQVESSLSNITGKLKKRIMICVIELIQNNIIHNMASAMSIRIFSINKKIKIESTQALSEEKLTKLKKHIDYINNMDLSTLDNIRRSNLTNTENIQSDSAGNGLITCRLKSTEIIDLKTNITKQKNKIDNKNNEITIIITFDITHD